MARRRSRKDSNIFGMLTQAQISELREAYNMLDVSNDGKLDKNDLLKVTETLGLDILSREDIEEMIGEKELTYMNLLTMVCDRLSEIDSIPVLMKAFKDFDEKGNGYIEENLLRKWLENEGDKMKKEDVDFLLKDCVKEGMVDYRKLACIMKYGENLESFNN
ncbi:myosin regulatory light chain [Tubulinosema ratisbonensis]|uniref:Myosin regulatory light chain n=1 Tax=Tubulinosema ratisbonensis TaxID=291195 RepID=A0A437AID3_9MICR|nr:myosin regulatory light chain [Tubulinosema ratisbonensis]